MVQPSLEVISGFMDLLWIPIRRRTQSSGIRRDITALKPETETGQGIRFPPRDPHTIHINGP